MEPSSDEVDDLSGRLGAAGPNVAYADHTDTLVPEGNHKRWGDIDPYAGEIRDGML